MTKAEAKAIYETMTEAQAALEINPPWAAMTPEVREAVAACVRRAADAVKFVRAMAHAELT